MSVDRTLCWDCQNALGQCCWSDNFTPVPGWNAIPPGEPGNPGASYQVLECPEFIPDPVDRIPIQKVSSRAEKVVLKNLISGTELKFESKSAVGRFFGFNETWLSQRCKKYGNSMIYDYFRITIVGGDSDNGG